MVRAALSAGDIMRALVAGGGANPIFEPISPGSFVSLVATNEVSYSGGAASKRRLHGKPAKRLPGIIRATVEYNRVLRPGFSYDDAEIGLGIYKNKLG